MRKLQKPSDWRGFEDAGLVWPCVRRMLHHGYATTGRNLEHTKQGDRDELVANFQLGVFGNFEIGKPEHVLNGPHRPGWSPIGGCVNGWEDGSESGHGPRLTRRPAEHTMNPFVSDEPQVQLEVGGITRIVFLVFADNVDRDNTEAH